MLIEVDCYAGYRGEETPRRFYIGQRRIDIHQVMDRWLAPDHRYFKVCGDDGDIYILRYEAASDRWELTFYRQAAHRG
jgi:hypothetical protein